MEWVAGVGRAILRAHGDEPQGLAALRRAEARAADLLSVLNQKYTRNTKTRRRF